MQIQDMFFDSGGRLRTGWRAIFFLVILAGASAIFGTIVRMVTVTFGAGEPSRQLEFLTTSITGLVPVLIVSWACGRWFENLPFRALGTSFTNSWLKHLLIGSLFGAGSIGLAVVIAAAFGNFSLQFNNTVSASDIASSVAMSFAVFAAGAAFEEALFRGYILQTLTRSGYAWLAIAMTAAFFGALHLRNPGANWISTANTILAGILFCAAYLRTRDLWFAFGIHLMWNFTQGSFFGIEVSGLTVLTPVSVLNEVDNGPVWLTGGLYGIEGGLSSTIALLVTIAAIYLLPLKQDPELAALLSSGHATEPVS